MSRQRALLLCLLLIHLLLATTYNVANPVGEAPDEVDHWAYVFYLARERSLPEGPRVTQSKHPPFYHAIAAVFASVATPSFDFLRANPDVAIHPGPTQSPNFFIHTMLEDWPWQPDVRAFHLARLWSTLLGTATVAATYAMTRAALPARPAVALFAAGLVATLPEFAFISGSINNDNAAAFFGALALWGGFAIYQRGGDWRAGWWTPVALGLGLLSKVSISALWPIVGLCIMLGSARHAATGEIEWRAVMRRWPRWVMAELIVFVPAVLIAAPWLVRNWRLYGDPTGMALVAQTIDMRQGAWTWMDTRWLLQGWFLSFWGKFGAVGHLPFPAWVYWLLGIVNAAGLAGLVAAWVNRPRERVVLALLALTTLAVAASMWRYSLLALGTDQGRLLFPAIGPILLLLAVGLAHLFGHRARLLGSAFVATLALLALYGLMGVIKPAFAPPVPPSPEAIAAIDAGDAAIDFGELTLQGWSLQTNPMLDWHATTQPDEDWRVNLRVTAEDGTLVWEWRRSPGYGRFSTDHWRAGTTVRDEYDVQWPDWAGPGRYRVEVTLYPFGTEPGATYPHTMLGWIERE